MTINEAVFRWLYGLAGQSAALDAVIVFLAKYAIFLLPVALAGYLLFYDRLKSAAIGIVMRALAAAFLAWFITFVIGELSFMPRPFVVYDFTPLVSKSADASAMPSGHTAFAAGFAFLVWLTHRRVGWWFLTTALLIGVARVAAGVHWPADIFFGFIVGILCALVTWKFLGDRRLSVKFKDQNVK